MPAIQKIRTVLLTSPYGDPDDGEIKENFPNGPFRTIGMVEVTLDNGVTGLGEGYLAVFAPKVFEEIAILVTPYLLGKDGFEIAARVVDLCSVCDYWSLQGAARHVTSAIEIALIDAKAKSLDIPAYDLFGGRKIGGIPVYGSGGCSETPEAMQREIDFLAEIGVNTFKIRSQNFDVRRTAWTFDASARKEIAVAVDMVQSLANPAYSVSEVVEFLESVSALTPERFAFLEEPLGPMDEDGFRLLRSKASVKISGGETLTTPAEIVRRIMAGSYDFVQPDASVIGGISAVMDVFASAKTFGTPVVVHAWGGPVAMLANYHAAFAGGGTMVELPMLRFDLREEMMIEPSLIEGGNLQAPQSPGIGVRLTPEIEQKYTFRPEAVYNCQGVDYERLPDSAWGG
jgi:L-alanine-DL-glutamate epimerase-like enolase superfamily enzyme